MKTPETQSPVEDMRLIEATPEICERLFAKRGKQRPFDKEYGEQWVRRLKDKHYILTPDPFMTDTDGLFRNGQHRAWGIWKSGITVPVYYIPDASEELIRAIDQAKNRTLTGQLAISYGKAHAKTLAPLTRRIWLWDHGDRVAAGTKLRPAQEELIELIQSDPTLEMWATRVENTYNMHPPRRIAGIGPTLIATAMVLASRAHALMAEEFWEKLSTGADLPLDSPILLLRNTLATGRKSTGNYMPDEKMALTALTWNHYRAGAVLTKLQLPSGGLTSKNFPLFR